MAVRQYDLDDVVQKVITVLEDNVPAKIAEINTLKSATGAEIMLAPLNYFYGLREFDNIMSVGNCVVEVTTSNIEGVKFDGGATTEDIFIIINLHLWENEDTFSIIEKKAYWYGRVLREIMANEPLALVFDQYPSNIKDTVVINTEYTMFESKDEVYMKTITLTIKMRQIFGYNQSI